MEVMLIAAKLTASTKEMPLDTGVETSFTQLNPETLDSAVAQIKKKFMIACRLYVYLLFISYIHDSCAVIVLVHPCDRCAPPLNLWMQL